MAPKKQTKPKKPLFYYAVGRRRTASARVRLYDGSGDNLVNKAPIGVYFPGEVNKVRYLAPLAVCDLLDKVHFTVRVLSSGKSSQVDAIVLGLSRALVKKNPDYHDLLKKQGLLTRDGRARERRKAGLGGRARHHKQSPKR